MVSSDAPGLRRDRRSRLVSKSREKKKPKIEIVQIVEKIWKMEKEKKTQAKGRRERLQEGAGVQAEDEERWELVLEWVSAVLDSIALNFAATGPN